METNFENPAYLKALRENYASEANDAEFTLWIEECRTRNMRPVEDLVLRMQNVRVYDKETRANIWKKQAIFITTIRALRKLAESTGLYDGPLPSKWVYLDKDGAPTVSSPLPLPDPSDPTGAKFKIPYAVFTYVKRHDFAEPTQGIARWGAYVQTVTEGNVTKPNRMWSLRGPEQLEKCSESMALRKAFPGVLEGLYVEEEISDDPKPEATTAIKTVEAPAPTQAPASVNQEPAQATDKQRPTEDSKPEKPTGKKRGRKPKNAQPVLDKASKSDRAPKTEAAETQQKPTTSQADVAAPVKEESKQSVAPTPKGGGGDSSLTTDNMGQTQPSPISADILKPDVEERGEIIKHLKGYNVDMSLLGTYFKKKMGVDNPTREGSKAQWKEVLSYLDTVAQNGQAALMKELLGGNGDK
jgi:outer membrane biosynthesis protein TonB